MLSVLNKIYSPSFSWKQKLKIVIVITLLGLILVTGSGYMGLSSVSKSFLQQKAATEYDTKSITLAGKLLQLKLASQNLTTKNSDRFSTDLQALKSLAFDMQAMANNLNYQRLNSFSARLSELVGAYADGNKVILDGRSIIGFSPNEGKLKNLYNAQKKLEDISFSMIEDDVINMITGQKGYLITKSKADKQKLETGLTNLEATIIDMGWEDIEIGQSIAVYRNAYDKIKNLIDKESTIASELQPVLTELNDIVQQQQKFLNDTVIKQVIAQADSTQQTAMNIMLIAAIIVGIIILISLGAIARELNNQLKLMQNFLKQVAEGNFSKRLETNDNKNDEFTQLKKASNLMVHDISNMIAQVLDGNDSLLEIRKHLRNSVKQLAGTSEEVDQKTQQSTDATRQISVAVTNVAERSVHVSETVKSASDNTITGNIVINDCVSSMGHIAELISEANQEVVELGLASEKMVGIIDVINGLADQTNLLALNAAIESARAGEAGRGFSVVADEVRALAQKTVNATRSIDNIIQDFTNQSKKIAELMNQGITLTSSGEENANNAKGSFDAIQSSIKEIATEMDQVVVAVEEISYNTNDIATQVGDICEQGETTKKIRQELEGYSHELSGQTKKIGRITQGFKLAD
jgi:methyl-accepting chemotaxis protein